MRILDHKLEPEGTAFQRLEVITGTGRRRRWSVDDKARIIAETLAPGAVTSEIARRYRISPQQIFGWRREARRRAGDGAPGAACFAPVMLDASALREPPTGGAAVIEIVIGGMIVRVPLGVDGAMLARVVQAVKAAS